MKATIKRNLGLFLSCLLALSSIGMTPIAKDVSWRDKISKELKEVIEISKPDDKIPVFIWIQDIDQEAVERQAERSIGFTKND